MAYPSDLVRTKDWGTEVLTDSDLEGQFDLVINWVMAALNKTSGHKHDGTDNEGPKISLTGGVSGTLPVANGGTGVTSGFLIGCPVGSLIMWGTDTAPTDYVLCDGSAYSRTVTYDTLFGVIGTTFGTGDGSTTFNVPDLRGRFPLGQDDMGGSSANRVTDTDADSLGGADGAETHTLTTDEMPAHTHTLETGPAATSTPSNNFVGGATSDSNTASVNSSGSGNAHNNMPPYITVNYIIRYQ